MSKRLVFVLLTILGVLVGGYIYHYNYQQQDDIKEENISSYNIQSRHECHQIKDNKKYNDCLSFYLKNQPYKKNERLVSTRLIE